MTTAPEPLQVGARLRALRKAQNRTLSYVAGKVGMSVPHLSDIERDFHSPTLQLLSRIANVLGTTVTGLIEGRNLMLTTIPLPGSPLAVSRGCLCPVKDNGNGTGIPGDRFSFWVEIKCPLHGTEATVKNGTMAVDGEEK